MSSANISFIPLRQCDAEAMLTWRYPAPYDFYNFTGGPAEDLLNALMAAAAEGQYQAVINASGQMIGFRSYGRAAQIEGGDYREPAVDIGGGLRPDMMARGLGRRVASAAIQYAIKELGAKTVRSTFPAFNERARSVCSSLGFRPWRQFVRETDGIAFEIMTYAVSSPLSVSPFQDRGSWNGANPPIRFS